MSQGKRVCRSVFLQTTFSSTGEGWVLRGCVQQEWGNSSEVHAEECELLDVEVEL